MRKLFYLLLIGILILPELNAQVVNTEKMRFANNAKKWKGNFDFNFGLNRTKAGQTARIGINGQVEFNDNLDKWILLSGYALTQFTDIDTPESTPVNFNNFQFAHLRYNRKLNEKFTWEAFIQEQWDEVHEIDLRLLVGTGPRIQLMNKDSSQLFFGLLYMYDYENNSPGEFRERNRDSRLSTYFAAGFTFKNVIINHIVYYQPLINRFNDFRVNSESSINVQVSRRLSFTTSFTLIFDNRPPLTVRKTRYDLSSGISLSF